MVSWLRGPSSGRYCSFLAAAARALAAKVQEVSTSPGRSVVQGRVGTISGTYGCSWWEVAVNVDRAPTPCHVLVHDGLQSLYMYISLPPSLLPSPSVSYSSNLPTSSHQS